MKKLLYIATIGLLCLPVEGMAQEDPARVDTSSARTHGMKGFSTFDPTYYQVQKRYRPWEGDSAWSKDWWRNITFGISTGVDVLHNYSQTTAQVPFNAFVGYRITPIHQLRLQGGYEEMNIKGIKGTYTSYTGEIQYLANLNNFMYGYDPNRHVNISTLLAIGSRIYNRETADLGLVQHALAPYGKLGFDVDVKIGPNVSFFVQPFVGFHRNEEPTFTEHLHDRYEVFGGVHTGFVANLQQSKAHYDAMAPMYHSFFYEAGTGWNFGFNNFNKNFSGNNYSMSIGRWIDPAIGFRLGVFGHQGYWNKNEQDFQFRKSNVHIGGRAEILLNVLNFTEKRRKSLEDPMFDLNVSAGIELGYSGFYGSWEKNRLKGRSTSFYGFTGAVQGLMKVSPGAYIYAEPRISYLSYNNPASYYSTNGYETIDKQGFMTLSVGTRIYGSTKADRAKNDGLFKPHWWTALDFGGMKMYQSHRSIGEGIKLQPAFGASLGYDLHPLATFRVQGELNVLGRDDHYGKTTKYNLLDLRAMYMFSMVNLLRGFDSHNKFQAYLETGPTMSLYMGQNTESGKGAYPEPRFGKLSPGWMAGMLMSYRVRPNWDVFAEVQGQYNLKPNFTVPEVDNNQRYYHNMKYGLYVGARYHFMPMDDIERERLHMDMPEWMKGWFFEGGTGWSKPFAHNSGSMYKASFGRWLSPLFGYRFGVRAQQQYHDEPYVLDEHRKEYQSQVVASGHVELLTDVLNWFPSLRADQDRKFGLNLFAGVNFGAQASNYHRLGSVGIGRDGNEMNVTLGFSAGAQALMRVAPNVQLYLEPSIYTLFNKVGTKLDLESNTNLPFVLSAGTRIMRPSDARALRRAGYKGDAEEAGINAEFKPHWWIGFEVGGMKDFLCQKYINDEFTGLTGIQPTFSFNVAREFTPLSTLRAQVETSFMNRQLNVGKELKHYNMTDLRLLYMLNFTNLWRGTRNQPRFSFYPEVGVAYSHKSFARYPGNSKNSLGVLAGVMTALRMNESWDLTAEAQIQQHFAASYMNQHHDYEANQKWSFTLGTRYHLPEGMEERERLALNLADWQKGWFFEGGTGWAKPFGHNSGSMYKASFGRWFSSLFGFRFGVRAQQQYHDEPDVLDEHRKEYQSQVAVAAHVELLTDVLNWFPSLRKQQEERTFGLNLFAGVNLGAQASNYKHLGSIGIGRAGNEMNTGIGFSAGLQGLVRVAPNVQLYLEPSVLSVYNKVGRKLSLEEKTNLPFTLSAGARIMRPSDARALRRAGYTGDSEEAGINAEFKPNWWFGMEVGGTKSFLCQKYLNDELGGLKGIQPTFSVNIAREFTPLSTLRAQLETSFLNRQLKMGKELEHYNMTDLRLLYMLNFTNLWRGTRNQPRFSFYPEVGVSYTHKSFNVYKNNSKNSLGLVAGVMTALRVSESWDLTAEAQIQHHFTQSFMNQHHDYEANQKWSFTLGTRYHLPTEEVERERLGLNLADWQKGWFFEGGTGWSKPFGHNSGSMYKASFGRWLNPLFGFRFGVRAQQQYHDEPNVLDEHRKEYQSQVAVAAHVELLSDVLNWFPSLRKQDERTFNLNMFAGINLGAHASNYKSLGSVGIGKDGNEMNKAVGFSVGLQGLVRVAPNVQLYLEPSLVTIYNKVGARLSLEKNTNLPFTLSAGARILRPSDARALRRAGYTGDAEEGGINTEFKPNWWIGLEVGGMKSFLCQKYLNDEIGGLTGIQPTFSFNVAREFTPLSTVRAQIETSFMNRQLNMGKKLERYNMTDLRLLYMLNFTNLWRGTRNQPRFSFYPEVGVAYSHKTFARYPGNSKNSFGLLAGVMTALRVGENWDLTAESQIQQHFAASYMNQHHDYEANQKWSFTLGTRYHLRQTTGVEREARHLNLADWQKGWFLEGGTGWAKPFGHNSGSMYKASIGRWINPFLGFRFGLRAQQQYHDQPDVLDEHRKEYQSQVAVSGHVELLTSVLNWFESTRADEDRKFDLNLFAGVTFGAQSANYKNIASIGVGNAKNEMNSVVGFSAGMQALLRVAPGVQIYVEPSLLSIKNKVGTQLSLDEKTNLPFALSAGARITRSADARALRKAGYDGDAEEAGINAEFKPNWWFGLEVGGAKAFLCQKYLNDDLGGINGIQPTVSLNIAREFTPLSTVRLQAETSMMNHQLNMGRDIKHYNMTDVRLLYMLNFTNLWRGTRNQPFFSFLPEFGVSYSHKTYAKYKTPSYNSKNSMGIVAGVMTAFRMNEKVDLTLESQIQENFAKCYMNQHHDREANAKWNFTVGMRYHFKSGKK